MKQEEKMIEIVKEGAVELDALVKELKRQQSQKFDVVVESDRTEAQVRNMHQDDVHVQSLVLDFPIDDPDGATRRKCMPLTEWGHRQLAEKMDIPWKYYERLLGLENKNLLADNINQWIGSKDQRFIRTMDGKVRAILSDKYRVIDHLSVFTTAAEKANEYGAKVCRASLTETKMYVKLVLPYRAEEIRAGDTVAPGIVVSNSEVGAGAFRAEMFVMRLLCNNGMIGAGNMSRFHLGAKQDVGIISQETINAEMELVKNQVSDMVTTVFDESQFAIWVDQLQHAAEIGIENPTLAVANVIREYKVPEAEQESILNELISTGDSTQYGLANAITAIAREKADPQVNIELERIAGKISIMDETPFERMVTREVPA